VTDFRALFETLSLASVEFILVGGVAAAAHGASRLTQYLDIVYRRTPENIARLVQSLQAHAPYLRGAPPGLPFAWSERTLREGLNFTLTTDLGDLDLLGEITAGGGYDDLLPYTITLNLYGIPCRGLNLRRLIEVKRAVGRPKDLEAIAELEAIEEESESS